MRLVCFSLSGLVHLHLGEPLGLYRLPRLNCVQLGGEELYQLGQLGAVLVYIVAGRHRDASSRVSLLYLVWWRTSAMPRLMEDFR